MQGKYHERHAQDGQDGAGGCVLPNLVTKKENLHKLKNLHIFNQISRVHFLTESSQTGIISAVSLRRANSVPLARYLDLARCAGKIRRR